MGKKKLSKEERKARRLARREAARRLRIQKEVQAKKDQLDRETRATEMNAVTVKRKWRDIMRKLRGAQLYDDFVALKHRYDRIMDMRTAMIEELRDALDVAEDQYNCNLQQHVATVDKMIEFFRGEMQAAGDWYRSSVAVLAARLKAEKAVIQERQDADMSHLQLVLFVMDDRRTEEVLQRRAETTTKLDEEAVKHAQLFHDMQTRLERGVESQWSEVQQALQQHHDRCAERRAAIAKLMAKEAAEHAIIAEHKRRTRHLMRQLEEGMEWARSVEGDSVPATLGELHALRQQRDEFRSAYFTLRDRMDGEQALDRRQLKQLVVESEAAVQKLLRGVQQAEKVVSLINLCQSLETADERAACPQVDSEDLIARQTPGWARARVSTESVSRTAVAGSSRFPVHSSVADDDVQDRPRREDTDKVQELSDDEANFMEEAARNLEGLSFFWARAGAAEVQRQQVRAQVSQLRDENLQLHDELRRYLRCVAPTWWGPEPVARGPPAELVYLPPAGPRGPRATMPWKGARMVAGGAPRR